VRGEDQFLGALFLALATLLLVRAVRAIQTGEVPLYKTRVTRGEVGPAKFRTIVALNGLVALGLCVLAADLFLGFGIRPH
jgi:hypothetical protein